MASTRRLGMALPRSCSPAQPRCDVSSCKARSRRCFTRARRHLTAGDSARQRLALLPRCCSLGNASVGEACVGVASTGEPWLGEPWLGRGPPPEEGCFRLEARFRPLPCPSAPLDRALRAHAHAACVTADGAACFWSPLLVACDALRSMALALPSPALRSRVRSRERAVSSCAPRSTLGAAAAHPRPVWIAERVGLGQPTRVRAAPLGAARHLPSHLASPRLMPQHVRARNIRALVVNPGDEGTPWVDPSSSDLLLSDLTEEVLTAGIASMLDVAHLAPASADDVAWPVRALLYGAFSRAMVSLVVSAAAAARAPERLAAA